MLGGDNPNVHWVFRKPFFEEGLVQGYSLPSGPLKSVNFERGGHFLVHYDAWFERRGQVLGSASVCQTA